MLLSLPMVGREAELAELQRLMDQAASGRGALILLGGEAGIGKTALLGAVQEQAGGFLSVIGRCPGPGETPSYGPLLQALGKLQVRHGMSPEALPVPFGELHGEWTNFAVAGSLAAWLGRADRPLLVALEDIHWADAATLEVLRHLPGHLADVPCLVVATYRTDELHRTHPLWTLLPQLQRSGAIRLVLDRLSPDAVSQLAGLALAGRPGIESVAGRLYRRTGGHSLLVRELLLSAAIHEEDTLSEEVLPETVQQSVDGKLARLSHGAMELLQAAAVIGERFDYDLLARTVDVPEDDVVEALEEAVACHVIRPLGSSADRFVFDHALVREALLARLIGPRRRRWHLRIGEGLLAGRTPDVEALALHLGRAGDPRAIDYLSQAGTKANRVGARAQAEQYFDRALELCPESDSRRSEIMVKLALCMNMDEEHRFKACLREALRVAEANNDHAVAVFVRAQLLQGKGDEGHEQMLARMAEVEQEEELVLNDPRYRRLLTESQGAWLGFPVTAILRVQSLAHVGRLDEARELIRRCYQRSAPGARRSGLLLGEWAIAARLGQFDRAADLSRQIAEERYAYGGLIGAAWSQWTRLYLTMISRADQTAEVDALNDLCRDLEAEAVRRSGREILPEGFSSLGPVQFWLGHWEEAGRNLAECWRRHPRSNMTHPVVAEYLLATGRADMALQCLADQEPLTPSDREVKGPFGLRVPLMRIQVLMHIGQMEEAAEWLAAAETWLPLFGMGWDRSSVSLTRADFSHRQGRTAEAWTHVMKAVAEAGEFRHLFDLIAGHRLAGEVAAKLGRSADAEHHFRDSLDLAERCRFPYEAGLTRLAFARALPGAPGSRAMLEEAMAAFERLGAAPACSEATGMLARQQTAAAAAPADTALPDGLTDREAEVVRLVAGGLSDKEVAACLYISPRTVDGHLRNVFNTVGVSNRAALAAYAARHGLDR